MKATIVLYASIFSSNYYDLGTELTSIKVITGTYYFCDIFFSPADSLSLSLSGEFRIPPSVPTELIVDFLVKHKQKSLDLFEENKRYVLSSYTCHVLRD